MAFLISLGFVLVSCGGDDDTDDDTEFTVHQIALVYQGSDGADGAFDDVKVYGVTAGKLEDELLNEGFEYDGDLPPDWTLQSQNSNYTWQGECEYYAHSGSCGLLCPWNYDQNEWLISPEIDVSGYDQVKVDFWVMGSVYWSSNYTLYVKISADGGETWEDLYSFPDEDETENWVWYHNIVYWDVP